MTNLPFKPETPIEQRICDDPEWQMGVEWGVPRRAHPEGKVINHVKEVLSNIDGLGVSGEERAKLRLIALVHDAFKYKVDEHRSRTDDNTHGALARRFAQRYIQDEGVLDIIELHDKGHSCYNVGKRHGDWEMAEQEARELIALLGDNIDLYLKFFECDNRTGTKKLEDYDWFRELALR